MADGQPQKLGDANRVMQPHPWFNRSRHIPVMSTHDNTLTRIAEQAGDHGLMLAGAFHAKNRDTVPRHTATVVLLAHAGSNLWPAFSRSDEAQDGRSDPLDRWSRRVVTRIAEEAGATVAMPSDGPPYWPFQQWATRATGAQPSPIGLLMHPEFGLWHAFRAALLFRDHIPLGYWDRTKSSAEAARADGGGEAWPCLSCSDQPCLKTCPVEAFQAGSYNVSACRKHLATDAGSDCINDSCRARRACPIASELRYSPDHARFHMTAFVRA